MSRIVLKKGKQKEFLDRIRDESKLEWPDIARLCNISERTLRDWRREKFHMRYESAKMLSKKNKIALRQIKKILPDYWSTKKAASIGAQKRYEIYGNPGTPEGRRKGGLTTIRRFRTNISFSKIMKFKLRKPIKIPQNSAKLAEFIGIMLGDGFIKSNKTQLGVTLNSDTDYEYSKYVKKLIKTLFNLKLYVAQSAEYKYLTLLVSSKNLVEFLIKKGLKPGYKVANKVDIPAWVKLNKQYRIECLKGLMDTDGSFYSYEHKVCGKIYKNFAICFTNYSTPLRESVYNLLKKMNFKPTIGEKRVYLHRRKEIVRYFKEISSSNPKFLRKYKSFNNL